MVKKKAKNSQTKATIKKISVFLLYLFVLVVWLLLGMAVMLMVAETTDFLHPLR